MYTTNKIHDFYINKDKIITNHNSRVLHQYPN